ncbi:protein phosphatase 2C 29-like [Cucurbita moschata]|uniref:Protein phosphatase 2C 29-like n=1 Tax=Cucurbita moschata TaxID=3662 RepID=A0A6J1FAB7_CUCMO|nr:protein phosphatase 2C 29-like [Cucurbita moschata]
MGSGVSSLFSCLKPETRPAAHPADNPDLLFSASDALDETLGHSFCYVRSSNRFLSPSHSDRFLSPSHSLRFSPPHEPSLGARTRTAPPETAFKAISGASVSANSSIPRSVLMLDAVYDDATDTALGACGGGCGVRGSILNGFESTSSFTALPLQTVPRGGTEPLERGGFFLSGPIERGVLSGPLDANVDGAGAAAAGSGGRVHFSAPLGGMYMKKKRKKSISGFRKAFTRNFSDKRPWVVPVLNFGARKESSTAGDEPEVRNESDVQWALGKAGEDRVHVVVSEEQGWLFVGIYDGFNGPDAPEFLMGNLYRAVFNELQGLFWEIDDSEEAAANVVAESTVSMNETNADPSTRASSQTIETNGIVSVVGNEGEAEQQVPDRGSVKRVTFQSVDGSEHRRRRQLWEYLAEDDTQDGLDLSGSDRFAFSVDDALSVNSAGSVAGRRWLLLSKLKQGLSKHKEGHHHAKTLFPWKYGLGDKEKVEEAENRVEETSYRSGKRRKEGLIDHELVLGALSRALEITELAYLDMTDKLLDTNPELALMGSCLLVVLMRDEDVYVMNVGDSRAIVAQYEQQEVGPNQDLKEEGDKRAGMEGIIEESADTSEGKITRTNQPSSQTARLTALQLSTDHSTSIEEEVKRIKNEHPDDKQCIVNDRVKGRLKVTRAFGAGFLKQPKLNDALLEMFRNEYIGTAPYLSCMPSLRHHRLCPTDQFIVLSSDGLYQYLTNEEVVSYVENFMEKFPDGDPAQHLIEELLCRAARKAGMDFHELLDIPQGDRRKYHDDVTVMVISLEGRIWKSSGKYL